jgi:hypothetical protein
MMKDPTLWKLERLSDRLAELLKEDPDPYQTMRNLSKYLLEEDLSSHYPKPKESPQQYAENVLRENPAMYDVVSNLPLPNLSAISSAEELINAVVPSYRD